MRILIALCLFLIGAASVAYSYVGTYLQLAQEMRAAEDVDAASTPFFALLDYILSGEAAPRLTTFLYIGALAIAISIFMLIVRPKDEDDRQDPV